MLGIKGRIKNIQAWRKIANMPDAAAWLNIVQDIMNFAVEVNQKKKPLLTQIRAVDFGGDSPIKELDIVSIWAGVGRANPIDRLSALRNQIELLRETVIEMKKQIPETEENKVLHMNISIALTATN